MVEVHPIIRTTHKSASKKSHEKFDKTTSMDFIKTIFHNVKVELHARLVNNILDIIKKNEKFRRITNQCFEHIPIMALSMGKYNKKTKKKKKNRKAFNMF